MFFYISGYATSFFKTEKPFAYGKFVWGKCTRILFPFIVAVPLFLIPMLWFERSYCNGYGCVPPGAPINTLDEINATPLHVYYSKWLANPGKLFNNISWLWYLPAMFVDFLLTYPILRWTKRRAAGLPFGRGDIETVVLQLVTMGVWMVLQPVAMPADCYHLTITSIAVLGAC
jgi:fucose 4-O-acetylase-like acetyltransferase